MMFLEEESEEQFTTKLWIKTDKQLDPHENQRLVDNQQMNEREKRSRG